MSSDKPDELGYLDGFELFGKNLESPSKKLTKTDPKHYDNNDTEFKEMLKNIVYHGLPDEYDTFNAEIEELYNTLERNYNAKESTEIIKEITKKINEEIENEKEKIKESTTKNHIQYHNNNIKRYQDNLEKLNELNDEEKADILEIYNNQIINKLDKHNAINAIINGDKVLTARPRDITETRYITEGKKVITDKSHNSKVGTKYPNKTKKGGKKSKKIMKSKKSKKSKSKKYIKSK
jgi:exonuclease VII large subunit